MQFMRACVFFTLVTGIAATSQAAVVPAGTVLAKKQALTRQITDEPASLDPIKGTGFPEIHIIRDLFEGLVNQDQNGKVIPGVASSWQQVNGTTWIFHLRPNARWSDGDPVTAEDFVYSFQRLVDPKNTSPSAWMLALAEVKAAAEISSGKLPAAELGVKALDSRTLQISLNKPVPYFLDILTNFPLFPVQAKTVRAYGNEWTRPGHLVGNGAFILTQRVVNEKIVLKPNPYYWDHQHTVLQKVTYMPINQARTAVQRYQANDLDIVMDIPNELYARLKKAIPRDIIDQPELGVYYYAFNVQRPPLDDVRVRQALSLAIDRQIIADKIVGMQEKPAWQFTPDITAGFKALPNPWAEMTQKQRNNKARELLVQAGYSKQHPLKITLLYNNSDANQKIAINISSMWKKTLGVETRLVNQEWKTYLDSRNSGQFNVIRTSWIGDYNDASSFLSVLTEHHANNFSHFHSVKYEKLLQQASNEADESKRNLLYNEAEEIIRQESPIAPIYQTATARLVKPWVKGFPAHNPENKVYSQTLYIIKH